MTFRVTVLGSSSAMPTLKRNPSAHALNVHEQFFLIDCGEGTQTRLFRCGISPLRLGAVFLTHLHGDHVYGLFGLMSTLGLLGRRTPLKIFAPRPFDRILASHLSLFDSQLPYEVQWEEIDTRAHRLLYENKTLEVWSIPLRHRVPAAGFLFREKTPPLNIRKEAVGLYGLGIAQCRAAKRGEDVLLDDGTVVPNAELTYVPYRRRSYAYLSDTLYSPRAAELVRGVDLLYHEATFADPGQSHGPENRTLDRRPSREGRAEGRRRKAADRPFLVPLSGRRSARKRGEEYFPRDRGRRRRRELRHPARHVRRAGTSGARLGRVRRRSSIPEYLRPAGRSGLCDRRAGRTETGPSSGTSESAFPFRREGSRSE